MSFNTLIGRKIEEIILLLKRYEVLDWVFEARSCKLVIEGKTSLFFNEQLECVYVTSNEVTV